jgi:hypothetical protein
MTVQSWNWSAVVIAFDRFKTPFAHSLLHHVPQSPRQMDAHKMHLMKLSHVGNSKDLPNESDSVSVWLCHLGYFRAVLRWGAIFVLSDSFDVSNPFSHISFESLLSDHSLV